MIKKYVNHLKDNVVGSQGFTLKSKITQEEIVNGKRVTVPDTMANQAFEDGWYDWAKPKNCDFEKRKSLVEILKNMIGILVTDGEVFVLKIRDKSKIS